MKTEMKQAHRSWSTIQTATSRTHSSTTTKIIDLLKKAWYNLHTQSDTVIDDLIYKWHQIYLNYEVLVGDLQRLIKVDNNTETDGGDCAPLNKFKTNYPVLFDCLYFVSGTMLSNSYGMMCHDLQMQVGMEQADHQSIYSTKVDYEMK